MDNYWKQKSLNVIQVGSCGWEYRLHEVVTEMLNTENLSRTSHPKLNVGRLTILLQLSQILSAEASNSSQMQLNINVILANVLFAAIHNRASPSLMNRLYSNASRCCIFMSSTVGFIALLLSTINLMR